jgi:protein-tyrosine phosphatase
MLCEGLAHIIATDTHDMEGRPPILSQGYACAVKLVGAEEAERLVHTRPLAILENRPPSTELSPIAGSKQGIEDYARRGSSSDRSRQGRANGSGHAILDWMQRLFS